MSATPASWQRGPLQRHVSSCHIHPWLAAQASSSRSPVAALPAGELSEAQRPGLQDDAKTVKSFFGAATSLKDSLISSAVLHARKEDACSSKHVKGFRSSKPGQGPARTTAPASLEVAASELSALSALSLTSKALMVSSEPSSTAVSHSRRRRTTCISKL